MEERFGTTYIFSFFNCSKHFTNIYVSVSKTPVFDVPAVIWQHFVFDDKHKNDNNFFR